MTFKKALFDALPQLTGWNKKQALIDDVIDVVNKWQAAQPPMAGHQNRTIKPVDKCSMPRW